MTRALAAAAGAAVAVGVILWKRQPILQAVATDQDSTRTMPAPSASSVSALVNDAGSNNVRAMLNTIRWAEGTTGENGYRTLFGGDLFDSYAAHPNIVVAKLSNGKPIKSTAAGAYQILYRTWRSLDALGLPDFSPRSQDLAAVELIRRRGALQDVKDGQFARALTKLAPEWASLPGAGYGQPEKRAADLVAIYKGQGGRVA